MSPFDSEPPRWLQEATKSKYDPEATGVALAGFANALSGGKSIAEGMSESRMNAQDPQWRLKKSALEANIRGQVTQNEMQYSKLQEYNKEQSNWQKDIPSWSTFMALPPEKKLTEPMPVFGSQRASATAEQAIRQAAVIQNQKTMADIRLKQADNQSSIGKIKTKVQEQAIKDIENLANDADKLEIGNMLDDNGFFTPEAINKLRVAPKKKTAQEISAEARVNSGLPAVVKLQNARKEAGARGASREELDQIDAAIAKQSGQKKFEPPVFKVVDGVKYMYYNGQVREVKNKELEMDVSILTHKIKSLNTEISKTIDKGAMAKLQARVDAEQEKLDAVFAEHNPAPEGWQKTSGGGALKPDPSTFPPETDGAQSGATNAPAAGWNDVGGYKVRVKP
jgi:hypothetical protein